MSAADYWVQVRLRRESSLETHEVVMWALPKHAVVGLEVIRLGEPGWRVVAVYASEDVAFLRPNIVIGPSSLALPPTS